MDSDKWTRLQILSKQVSQIGAKLPKNDIRWELEVEQSSIEFICILKEGLDEATLFLNDQLALSEARNKDSRRDFEQFLSSNRFGDKCSAGSKEQCCKQEETLFISNKSERNVVVDELEEMLRKEEEKILEKTNEAEHLKLEVAELSISLKDAHQEICALWAQKEIEASKTKSIIEGLNSQVAKDKKEIEDLSKYEADLQTLVAGMRERCQDHAQLKLKNKHLSELIALSQKAVNEEFHRAESQRAHNEHLQNQLHAKDVQINSLSATVAFLANALRSVDMNSKQLNLPFIVPAECRNWLENYHANMKTFGLAGTDTLPANTYDRTPNHFDRSGVHGILDPNSIGTVTSNNKFKVVEYSNAEDEEVEKTLSWRPLVPMAMLMAEANAAMSYSAAQVPELVHFTDKAGGDHVKPEAVPMREWLVYTKRY